MRDCSEGEDEAECGDEDRIQDELNLRYRMSRFNRYDDFYDNWDGDWAWLEANIDEDREQVTFLAALRFNAYCIVQFLTVPVPETCDDWFLTAFSVSAQFGLTVVEELVEYGTCRPLWLFCEAPERAKRGETLTVKCTIFNWTPDNIEVVLILQGSDQFRFVSVEEHGYVVSFAPRLSSGDHHHLVFVRAEATLGTNPHLH